ncbi:MAG: STAS domain-containing protein [Nibricoccus sp.]
MPDTAKPAFLVDVYSDPILVRIEGRASFQNSACLHDFFNEMMKQGKVRFVLDFQNCTSMDSTFLGVMAGAALALRKKNPPGSLVIVRASQRNLELIRNLGLHRLVSVDAGNFPMNFGSATTTLECGDRTELEHARLVLQAHENLVTTDEGNRAKFQDVLTFLKNRVEQK